MNNTSGMKKHRVKFQAVRVLLFVIVVIGCIALVWKRSDFFAR